MHVALSLLLLLPGCADPSRRPHPGKKSTTTSTGTPITTPTWDTGTDAAMFQFAGEAPTNLLVFSVDTLRKDYTGIHAAVDTTPFLDGLADHMVIFDDHVQCSNWTTASCACTMAGSLNMERGVALRVAETAPPDPDLSSWLGEAGYHTIFSTGNGFFSPNKGLATHFDESSVFGDDTQALGEWGIGALTDAIARGDTEDGWYLHLHSFEPHALYQPEEDFLDPLGTLDPWPDDLTTQPVMRAIWDQVILPDPDEQALLETHLQRLYRGEIRMMDSRMRTLWDELETAGLLDDTLVVFWSDHGEQFWERGIHTHAYELNAEENDAILWFWAKNLRPSRVRTPSQSIDMVPTVLELLGQPIPSEVTGLPLDELPSDRPRFTATHGKSGVRQAVIKDDLKLIYFWGGATEFYDRIADPKELSPLSTDDPRASELWCLLKPKVEELSQIITFFDPVDPDLGTCP